MKQEDNQLPKVSDESIERYNDDAGTSAIAVRSLDDIKRLSTIFIGSGMFKGDKSLSQAQQIYQAGVKIIAGVEFGIQPFAAMRGINIINGNAEMSANLMAAKVKKHPKYDYRVKKWDRDGCVLEFLEISSDGTKEVLGESSFDSEDAKMAGLSTGRNAETWRKFARNMYFARAMSNGVRIYTPDVFYGAPVYVEGEISGEFDKSESAPSEARQQTADAEVVDPAETVYRDIAAEEAEIVERANDPESLDEGSSTVDDADDVEANIQKKIIELDLPMEHKRSLVRVVTGKPFLKNCTPEEMTKVAEAIEEIEAGTFEKPQEWLKTAA